MFNLFLPKEQTARIVFVLKLIAIQDLLKEGKLSIIKNKMQKSLLHCDRMATFAPSILETSKKQSRWWFVWNWPPKTITRQVPQKNRQGQAGPLKKM